MLKKIAKKYLPKPVKTYLINSKKYWIDFFIRFRISLYAQKKYNWLKSLFQDLFNEKPEKIVWLDQLEQIKVLKPRSSSYVASPKYNGFQQKKEIENPEICIYKLSNARVVIESSHIILEKEVVMDRLPHVLVEECNYATGLVKAHNKELVLLCKKNRAVIYVENGLFFGGNGSWNYYHLVFEIFSKIFYLQNMDLKIKDTKIILHQSVCLNKNYKSLLDILLTGYEYELIFVDKLKVVKVQNLYHITPPSNIVFNVKKGGSFLTDYVYFDKESVDYIRNKVLSEVKKRNLITKDLKRVFLARKPGSERCYNQDEVYNVLKKYDFTAVYLEDLSLLEQAKLFNELDFVIGPSGAAWTNLIYLSSGVKALSWLPSNISDFSAYSSMAHYFDCDMSFIKCEPDDGKELHTSYKLNLHVLESEIKELIL
ncbi:glycosyltransferase family 61 protein [Vibrio metschnikovii]|uniref:glycosyltransferase family 61 protein n=1 Tax=Vibrio metschnikovii TaxID=28172 RepID=UPI00315C54B0